MRTEEDIVRVSLLLSGSFELDMQRIIEDDPNWKQISAQYEKSSPKGLEAALIAYVNHYIVRERLLRDSPCTNGPGELRIQDIQITFTTEAGNGTLGSSVGSSEAGASVVPTKD
jgi:hypothetical protein